MTPLTSYEFYIEIRYQVIQKQSLSTEHSINNMISDAVPLSVSLDEIKSETLSDLELCSIIQSVNTDFWDKKILQEFCNIK